MKAFVVMGRVLKAAYDDLFLCVFLSIAWWACPIVLVLLLGCWALADGAATIAQAFGHHGWGQRVGLLFLGALTLVAAVIAITRPGLTAATLTWILGIWLVVRGLFEILAAFFSRSLQTSRWILVLSGVVDGVIGVVLMANPGAAALSIAFLIGLLALVWGLVFLGLAFAVRRREKGSASGAQDASTATA